MLKLPKYRLSIKPASIMRTGLRPFLYASVNTKAMLHKAPKNAHTSARHNKSFGKNKVTTSKAICAPLLMAKVLSAAKGLRVSCCSNTPHTANTPPANMAMAKRGKTLACITKASNDRLSAGKSHVCTGMAPCCCHSHIKLTQQHRLKLLSNSQGLGR